MFAMELSEFHDIAQTIVTNAIKEATVEEKVQQVVDLLQNINFKVIKKSQDHYILGSIEELIQILEDNTIALQNLKNSQYIEPFLETVQKWEVIMREITEVVEVWTELQTKLLYLTEIFIENDVRIQLPEKTAKFDQISNDFKEIMLETSEKLNVYECCMISGRKQTFENLLIEVDDCLKSLHKYLNCKRMVFPRFSFLSDEELLRILSENNITLVQKYFGKMFNNLEMIKLESVSKIICTGVLSCEYEMMELKNSVIIDKNIEKWMEILLKEMKESNRYLVKKAIYDYGKLKKSRIEWVLDFQGVVIFAANQIWRTAEIEQVFENIKFNNNRAMKEYLLEINNQLNNVVIFLGEKSLSNNDRKKLDTLITIDVNNRDTVEEFVKNNIIKMEDFKWQSQLKFYWINNLDNCWVDQCTGRFQYGYEYVGLSERLVITPLTDRIYLTITQALKIHLGASLTGFAGTGKTETVKNLANTLGLLCIVTNCTEEMEHVTISKIFKGLIQCGAWGCFDHFDRINLSVKSAISSQLQTIRSAFQCKASKFLFDAQEITLDSKFGLFITMETNFDNRSQLPESVKVFFRPVVVVLPDSELICQVKLYSVGFLSAKTLAKKMIMLYHLVRDQLSKQKHYDFGLRSLVLVLNLAKSYRQTWKDLSESNILVKALTDINIPKLIGDDECIFVGLLKNLFSESDYSGFTDESCQFLEAVQNVYRSNKFIILPKQIDKVLQLCKLTKTRHVTAVVGPTGGGKTTIIKTFCKSQSSFDTQTKLYVVNPKAYDVTELYGVMNSDCEWSDGILSNIFRKINQPLTTELINEKSVILFDGDVDSIWIENINSVMDDNKLLTLANQERIKLHENCNLIFEVGDLQYASPATVSRLGIIYVDPNNLGYEPFFNKWIDSRYHCEQQFIMFLFKKYIPGALGLVIDGELDGKRVDCLQMIVHQTSLNLVCQLCKMIDALYPFCHHLNRVSMNEEEIHKHTEETEGLMEAVFIEACYCSLGAAIVSEAQCKFDNYMKETSGLTMVNETTEKPASIRYIPITYKLLYDYVLDVENEMWKPWKICVSEYNHDRSINFNDILVPTTDTLRTLWFIKLMQSQKQPVLLAGETGTAKTATIQSFSASLDPLKFALLKMNFSYRTKSIDIQTRIESYVEKRTRDLYSPRLGRTLGIFIDDMSLPLIDNYGTQQPIAFLKLFLDYGGFHDRKKNFNWKQIKDTWFLATITGERRNNTVDPRFISLLAVYYMAHPNDVNLNNIYSNILAGHLSIFSDGIKAISNTIIRITVELYKIVKAELPPIPSKFHYNFNMRDLSKICGGLIQSSPNYFSTAKQFVRLWRNEFTRIICDRLINEEDRSLVQNHLESKIKSEWTSSPDIIENALRDPLLFGNFRNALNNDQQIQSYEDVLDYEAVYNLFIEILELYNEKNTKLDMILFNEALEHLIRVNRIIKMERGHLLLVGISGSGKQSIIRLASFAVKANIFEISLDHTYNETFFHRDIKKLLYLVGIENNKTLFLFPSAQIIDDYFLEIVNNILVGEIPFTLYTENEIETIINKFKVNGNLEGNSINREDIWGEFTKICRKNLHIALSMSPVGNLLKKRCRNYPEILKSTTINWMFSWPRQALFAVVNFFIKNNKNISEDHYNQIVEHIVDVHVNISAYTLQLFEKYRQNNYTSPKHYLDFIKTFLALLTKKKSNLTRQYDRLLTCLNKIDETSKNFEELTEELSNKKKLVIEQAEQCEKFEISTELDTKLKDSTLKKLQLQEEVDSDEKYINLVDKMMKVLLSDSNKWKEELENLKEDCRCIIGDCLLSAGFLIYCGPFTSELRTQMIKRDWRKSIIEKDIPISESFDLITQFSDINIKEWDEFSAQNKILTMYSSKLIVCIDPHQQALDFIKKTQEKPFKIISFCKKDYLEQFGSFIGKGFTIIFKDFEYYHHILDQIVVNILKSYDAEFRIFFITKTLSPNFSPTMYSKATIINYMITQAALEHQLLSTVVEFENPDVENDKNRLTALINTNKSFIIKSENEYLDKICTNQSNLLQNITLFEDLVEISNNIRDRASKNNENENLIGDFDKVREFYRPIAQRGAILFFVLTDLAALDSLYQYSLSIYLEIFINSLKQVSSSNLSTIERLENIMSTLTVNVFDYCCLGCFEKHKILLAFYICIKIELSAGRVSQEEYNYFIDDSISINCQENDIEWLESSKLKKIVQLSTKFEDFSELYKDLYENSNDWYEWYKSEHLESNPCPGSYSKKLRPFQKLMLVKCLRIDRVYCGIIKYVTNCLGERFILPQIKSFEAIYQKTNPRTPVILILNSEAELRTEFLKLIELNKFGVEKLVIDFLGAHQEKKASGLLETAIAKGQFLVLQNCHLLLKFIEELEPKLNDMENFHPEFRLWLATNPVRDFPIGILQRSLKVVVERPNGLKLNLINSYSKLKENDIENCSHPKYKHIIYILAFFHGIIQERKKYGKIGWNLNNDFSDSDFTICSSIIDTYLTNLLPTSDFPWASLKYLISQVIYGGKVIDRYDRRIIEVYVDQYFGEFIFDPCQRFYLYKKSLTFDSIPSNGTKNDYISFIDNLSFDDSPEIFGLHSNAEINYFCKNFTDILTNLHKMAPQQSIKSLSKLSKEEIVDKVAKDVLHKIPTEFNINKIKNNFGLAVTPPVKVLFQELEIFNKLINKINSSLTQLRNAIAGETIFNTRMENLSCSLYNGELPKEWANLTPETKKNLGSWIINMERRRNQYSDWSGSNEPIVIWLSGFYSPESYIAAFFQMTCEKNNWPFDKYSIYTTVSKFYKFQEIEERLCQSCYVHGLFLEGARWDREQHCLKESYSKIMFDELPVLSITPKKSNTIQSESTVNTPVYVTTDRGNCMGEGLVFEADLQKSEHDSFWILQGLCLLLNID